MQHAARDGSLRRLSSQRASGLPNGALCAGKFTVALGRGRIIHQRGRNDSANGRSAWVRVRCRWPRIGRRRTPVANIAGFRPRLLSASRISSQPTPEAVLEQVSRRANHAQTVSHHSHWGTAHDNCARRRSQADPAVQTREGT